MRSNYLVSGESGVELIDNAPINPPLNILAIDEIPILMPTPKIQRNLWHFLPLSHQDLLFLQIRPKRCIANPRPNHNGSIVFHSIVESRTPNFNLCSFWVGVEELRAEAIGLETSDDLDGIRDCEWAGGDSVETWGNWVAQCYECLESHLDLVLNHQLEQVVEG